MRVHAFRAMAVLTLIILTTTVFLNLTQALAETAASEVPASVRIVLNDVSRLLDQKQYDRAIAQLRAFQSRGGPEPAGGASGSDAHHHPMIYFALGNCYLLQERYPQAQKAFALVTVCRPEMVPAWLNLAKACYEGGQPVQAAQHFAEAYRRSENKQPEHLYYSAAAYLMAQKYAQAIAAFEQLGQAHASQIQPVWREHWVHALLADGQSRRALPHIKALIRLHTGANRIRWQEILLYQYMQLRLYAEAGHYALALARAAPEETLWWKVLGQIQTAAGNYEKALAALTIYGYLTPLSADEKKLWADLSLQAGIPGQAAQIYAALLKENQDGHLLKKLVTAYRRIGDPESALKQLEQSVHAKTDAELLMLRADVLYEMKRYAEAMAAYRQAARGDDARSGRAWLMAGYAAWQANDIAASRQAFERAAGFSPQRKAALTAVRQLQAVN